MRVSKLSLVNSQCPGCKTKQKKTIIDQCLLKCALPLQFGCSWVTSLVLIICVTLLELMLCNHRLCSPEKVKERERTLYVSLYKTSSLKHLLCSANERKSFQGRNYSFNKYLDKCYANIQ